MKHQYFGDINDYRKYGLIRCLQREVTPNIAVAWALTPDDDGPDGRRRAYLSNPSRWEAFDPQLFSGLRGLLKPGIKPHLDLLASSRLLEPATFFSNEVPDARTSREEWGKQLARASGGAELVFLDPDNGLEVTSRPIGRKGSSKYVFWHEVSDIWNQGASLLIYQHFCREKRDVFIPRMVQQLQDRTGASVEAFRTAGVLFLLACKPHHVRGAHGAIERVADVWKGQITPYGFMAA